MAHYAKIKNSIVTEVIVADKDFINLISKEGDLWLQTSYNTRGGIHYDPITKQPSEDQKKSLRKNYAGVGYSYDKENDAFIPPKIYKSWTLNKESFLWEPPYPIPDDETPENLYSWNESSLKWEKVNI